jgi:hypothetical protein
MNRYPTEGKYNRLSLKNETRDKSVCDGFDCLEYAKNTVRVNLGEASSILLHLCNNCVKIFPWSFVRWLILFLYQSNIELSVLLAISNFVGLTLTSGRYHWGGELTDKQIIGRTKKSYIILVRDCRCWYISSRYKE